MPNFFRSPPFRIFISSLIGLILTTAVSAQTLTPSAGAPISFSAPTPLELAAKSWLLIEAGSGQVLAAEKPDERLEPASLTKLMTAYLTFSAMRQRTIALEQMVPVSETAWRTGGSKMFIRVGEQVLVEDLIKGMIVQSGNDACIALAEAIAGSEAAFAQRMNLTAQQLGMSQTQFMNATGLPDAQHFTTARDLSKLALALIRDFPVEYGKYYSLKEFKYGKISQPNRNRLLFIDPTVDGVKTGHTDAAGYCLIASAKRGPRRLLSVVLGTASDNARATESQKLLNWGFQFYDAAQLYAANQVAAELRVWKGANKFVKSGFLQDLVVALPKTGDSQPIAGRIKVELLARPRLVAPISVGQVIGTLKLSLDGRPEGEYPVYALEEIPLAGWFTRILDTIRMWFA
jgi:serine-type D-Ala-D-Ala carboxypeptidase (penicillin-binding protein 5/6)